MFKRFILTSILLAAMASTWACSVQSQAGPILSWLIQEQQKEWSYPVAKVKMPRIRWYDSIHDAERIAICGDLCERDRFKYQLNMFFPKVNEIWLARGSREDQLAHELYHTIQYAMDPTLEGSSDQDEMQAVLWQQRYQKAFGTVALCEAQLMPNR